ncbi:hypothetical protein SAMN02800691_2746 [Luteibacter sp. UNCMF366Tsu5.1]|uniref:hypothetical protein n=1 Tax=Luteibacter flocculans TaxID=2780091 RepID=UPI0009090F87|nr:hypothetical protein [Luteibacter flocculans]SFW63571.1 hypothetical protein SAMN02800691_2746 [Luteibacter sp. UNCMF366Tsu5.1]
MLQLNPPLPLNTPKGEGFAHFLIDYGPESDLYWTVFITETGEIWTFANREVRASKNITLGRTSPSQPRPPVRRVDTAEKRGERAVVPLGSKDA